MITTMMRACVLSATLCVAQTCFADLHIIVNKANTIDTISTDELSRLYLQKSKRFSNDQVAVPISQVEGAAARDLFNRQVLGRDEQQLKYYWSRRMFSGGGRPPEALASDAAVVERVSQDISAVGYVSAAPNTDAVKSILIVK